MHELIAAPYLDHHLLVRPGSPKAARLPVHRYEELHTAPGTSTTPTWLADVAGRAWEIDLSGRRLGETVLVRARSPYGYGRASYELNLGCNYDCEHCYLGLKQFAGLEWPERERLLHAIRDSGVLWLQLTGGEPMIDKLFPETYRLAYELGMMVEILTNGSRLAAPKNLALLTRLRPNRITLSLYGATAESYDGLTRRRGAYRMFVKGLDAAHEAGLPLDLALIITRHNAHEADLMRAFADRYGLPYREYTHMSPTIYGGAETLATQAPDHLADRDPFNGCNAGHTFFHVDPHGMASICKVGRDEAIPLMTTGVEGLSRLGGIADSLMLRTGGCTGCQLSGTCRVCRPLAKVYQEAKAPLDRYCQHATTRS
ncbi:radical SAM protein [Streptomyces sp. NPDC051644]|uniref:radical SAM protein n=1 Tax=Streptomyces sp. NPDC051644 TaxID=3365666 RepID=UPI00378D2DE9